jgi:hypothetical protein
MRSRGRLGGTKRGHYKDGKNMDDGAGRVSIEEGRNGPIHPCPGALGQLSFVMVL